MVMENALQSKFHLFFTNPHFHLQEITFKCHSKLVLEKIGLAIINARKNMPRLDAIHFNDQTFWVK